MKNKFRKNLLSLERLRVGEFRDVDSGIFLDRNERIVPFPDNVMQRLTKRIAKSHFNLYPDISPFYQRLAGWLKVKEEQLYITEGVSGAIKALMETISKPKDNIVYPVPTFALYNVYTQMFDVKSRTVGYTDYYKLDTREMLSKIDKNTAMVFLPNPNVPIEGTLNLKELARIARCCKKYGAFLVIDEVYFPFGGPSSVKLIKQFDNLLVMRSFSKAFGLAGIRLGYIIGNKKIINYVSKMRTGYETNVLSMEVASFFIENYQIVDRYIKQVKGGLSYLKRELNRLGLEYNGGNTSNHIFVRLQNKEMAKSVSSRLRKRKIYIRASWPKPYQDGFSVTGAPIPIMKKFIREFSTIYKKLSV